MFSVDHYYLSVINKTIDIDGAYGGQCWDLYAHYMKTLGYSYAYCTASGYVKDIWNQKDVNGMMKSCIIVSVNDLQDGDIIVWGNCAACPKSHIAIFRKYKSKSEAVFLGQNQAGKFVNQQVLTLNGVLGAFRPKCLQKKCPFKKSGSVIAIENGIRVRSAPTLSKNDTGARYNKGERLNYIDIVEAEDWHWAKYISYSGKIHYCALCKSNGSSPFWKQI